MTVVLLGLNLLSINLANYIINNSDHEIVILSRESINQLIDNELIVNLQLPNYNLLEVREYLSNSYNTLFNQPNFTHLIFDNKPDLLNYLYSYSNNNRTKILNTWEDLSLTSPSSSISMDNEVNYANMIRCQYLVVRSANPPTSPRSHKSQLNQLTNILPISNSNQFIVSGPLQINDSYRTPRNSDTLNLLNRAINLFPEFFQSFELVDEKVIFKSFYQNSASMNGDYNSYHNNNSHDIINHPSHPLNPQNKYSIGNISYTTLANTNLKILNFYGFGFNDYNLLDDLVYYFQLLCSSRSDHHL